jgi:hypothetical protein
MDALAPLLATLAGLLALAGAAKLRAPLAAALALDSIGIAAPTPAVRAIGLAEIALGVATIAAPSRLTAGLLALAYVLFAAVVARMASRAGGSVPCGCFGAGSFTATRAHAGFDLAAATFAALAVISPPPGVEEWFADPLAGVTIVAAVLCSVWLAYVAFTLLPATWGAPAR